MSQPIDERIADLLADHYRDLFDRARRLLRSDCDAEDAVQAVMLAVLEAPEALAGVDRIGAWLFTLVRRRCASIIRGNVRRRAREGDEFADDLFADIDGTDRADEDELVDRAVVAIEALPDELREPFVANAIEGVTFRELSARTGAPMGTLMARKKRAADRIRAELEGQGFTGRRPADTGDGRRKESR